MGIATDVEVSFISVGYGWHDGMNGHLDLANYLLELESPPKVVSTSYGSQESIQPIEIEA